MGCLVVSLVCSTTVTVLCIVAGYSGAGFVFGAISGLLLLGGIATLQEQARDKAETEEREQIRKENLLRPNIAWWSAQPIPAGAAMKVSITGYYQEYDYQVTYSGWYIDACSRFRLDHPPGKYSKHQQLFADNLPDALKPFRAAEHLHSYDFLYHGTGDPPMLLLKTYKAVCATDGLSVSILPLSASDRELAGLDQPAEEAEPEEVDPFPKFERRAYLLSHKYGNAAYADDTWLTQYAKREAAQLLQRKDKITAEYVDFHRDQPFIAHLQEHHPDVYTRATWEARALFLAEQYAVDPPSTKPATPDEWRERDLRRRDVASQDFMSRAEQRLAREQEFEARLREKFPHLTADQINTEITKYRQEVLSKEDDYGTSSNGQTYRQV